MKQIEAFKGYIIVRKKSLHLFFFLYFLTGTRFFTFNKISHKSIFFFIVYKYPYRVERYQFHQIIQNFLFSTFIVISVDVKFFITNILIRGTPISLLKVVIFHTCLPVANKLSTINSFFFSLDLYIYL